MAKRAPNNYVKFLQEMAKLSARIPNAKTPKLLNSHLMVNSPFPEPSSVKAMKEIDGFEVKRKSEMLYSHIPSDSQVQVASKLLHQRLVSFGIDLAEAEPDIGKKYVSDVPIPNVLRRHVANPSSIYAQESSVGKVCGFRIEVNGKRGTRAAKQVVHYGRLGTKDSHNSMVDFGRASFFNKKGATGVKVWVGYSQ